MMVVDKRSIMGIDPSLSGFAVAIYIPDNGVLIHETKTIAKEHSKSVRGRRHRYRVVIDTAFEWAKKYNPKLILVEGYSYGSRGKAILDMAELGFYLRDHMIDFCDFMIEIPPPMLKKFACGHGRAGKGVIKATLEYEHGIAFKTHNEADAFALLRLGCCCVGYYEIKEKYENEIVKKVKDMILVIENENYI